MAREVTGFLRALAGYMCFSATASFASAGVLVGIGSIALARTRPAPLRLLAAVPLLFGLQQAAEGVVWKTLEQPSSPLHLLAVQVFLGMALVLWPLLMPASLLLAETDRRRRSALALLLTIGAAVAVYGVASLLSPTSVSVHGCSLEYDWDSSMPWLVERLFGTAYLVAAVCPFLASSVRWSRAIGLAFVGAFGASILLWQATLPSVWCFFAALLSILIVLGPLGEVLPARLATAVLLLAAAVPSGAGGAGQAPPPADEVMARLDDLYRSEASIARVRMTVATKRSTRELEMTAWSRGTEKTLVVIESPEREKGTATLKVEKNLWNWFPRIARTVRVPPSMMLGSWMGSDFTNDDLVQEGRFQDDYVTRADGRSETPDGWRYVSEAKPGTAGLWKKVEIVVTDDLLPLESRFYDRKGRLARTLRYEDIREVDGRKIPLRMVLVPADDDGRRTTMEYLTIDFDAKVPEDTFSLSRLESGR